MAFADSSGDPLDLVAVGDVTRLCLGPELGGDALEPLPAAREEDAAPAPRGQPARERCADSARASGDDCDANTVSVLAPGVARR